MSVAILQAWLYSIGDTPPIGDKAMKRNWLLVMLSAFVLLSLAPAQQKAPLIPNLGEGRFQLKSLTVDEDGPSAHEIFLLDSQTGKVWRYQPNSVIHHPGGKDELSPEMLVPVGVGTHPLSE